MKKILIFIGIILFSVSSPISSAQMPSAVTGPAAVTVPSAAAGAPAVSAASELEKAGVVAAVGGKVEIKTPGQTVRVAASGQPVFIREEVTTDAQGHLQILFLDQTVFTIGPNSRIVIDEFVYDPKTRDGKIKASITKGVFRYVSGKIAAKQSKNVSVSLPTATIGFRGPIVGGQVMPDNSSLAALLGPGDNNDAGERSGSFVMQGTGGNAGDQQEVNRTGFGVGAGADGNLSGVFQLSEDQINGLTAGLSPSGGNGSGGGSGSVGGNGGTGSGQLGGTGGQGGLFGTEDMGTLSGETGALTGQNSLLTGSLTNLTDGLNDTSTQNAQDARNSEARSSSSSIANTRTSYAQLDSVESGVYHYYATGTFTELTSDSYYVNKEHVGTFTASWDVDFDHSQVKNIKVGTAVSWADEHLTENGKAASEIYSASFSAGGDSCIFNLSNLQYVNATIELWNDSNGTIAGLGKVKVNYGTLQLPSAGSSDWITATANTLATLEQLTQITTGTGCYNITGAYNGIAGAVTGKINIDFGAQKIGGGDSFLTVTDILNNSATTNGMGSGKNFSDISGGRVTLDNIAGATGGTFSDIDVTLVNSGGVTAKQAEVDFNYAPGASGNPGWGNGTGTGTLTSEPT